MVTMSVSVVLCPHGRGGGLVEGVRGSSPLPFLDLLEVALQGRFSRDLYDGAATTRIM